jgi:hypothetical protein
VCFSTFVVGPGAQAVVLRVIEIIAGAGFVVPILLVRDRSCSEIMCMPGLMPAAEGMDTDANSDERVELWHLACALKSHKHLACALAPTGPLFRQ